MTEPTRLPELTGLRFVAALGVVAVHMLGLVTLPLGLAALAGSGSNGVQLFFVLSGFLLTLAYGDWFTDGTARRGAFWWARVARIYPLYLISFLLSSVLILSGVLAPGTRGDHSAPLLAGSWLATLLLVHSWAPHPAFHFWHGVSWSLACEAFMYALFPALMARLWRRTPNAAAAVRLMLTAALGACLATTVVAAGLVLARVWLDIRPAADHWFAIPATQPYVAIWPFILGCSVGLWHRRGGRLGLIARQLVAVGVPLVWLIAAWPLTGVVPALVWPLLATGLSAAWIAALASGPTSLTPVLAHPVIVLLGEASYALFLFHSFPIDLLVAAVPPGSLPLPLAGVLVAGLAGVSCLAFLAIERPAQRILRAWRPSWPRRRLPAVR